MKLSSLTLFSILLFFSSCTFVKTVVYFKPSINDHKKIFPKDTIQGNNLENWATSLTSKTPLFVDLNNSTELPPIETWVPMSERLKTTNLDDFLKKSKTTSLIVIRNDSILFERYLGEGAKGEAKVVFSVSKAITATLTAIAVEEGLLSLDQKVGEFIPAFAEDARKDITLRHLLGMVSGLKWDDFGNLIKLGGLYYNGNQQRFVAQKVEQVYEPNTHFTYKSVSTQILGICLEKALKRSLASYLEEKIWQPVGMQYDAMITLDSKKYRNSRAFGGMVLAPHDMIRFAKLMLNKGIWEGKQIVPAWFVTEVETRSMERWFGYENCFWRNGYETEDVKGNQQYWAAGYGGQYIYVAPKENMILVRTGSDEKNRWSVVLGRLTSILAIGKTDLTDTLLDFGNQFEGVYLNDKGQKMTLKLLAEKDKYGSCQWSWKRDLNMFPYGKQHKTLTQFDGVSLGYKKQGVQTRFYYDIKDGEAIGFYYNSWPSANLQYFKREEN